VKDYELRTQADRITACGYDDRGVMHGLYKVTARSSLREAQDRDEKPGSLDRMISGSTEETVATRAALERARRDSRFGYKWEQGYIYTPHTVEEKFASLRAAVVDQIPADRRSFTTR
jgi:hypothetical protein